MKHAKILLILISVLAVLFMMASYSQAVVRNYYIRAEVFDGETPTEFPGGSLLIVNPKWEFAPFANGDNSVGNLVHCIPGPAPCAIPEPFCTEVVSPGSGEAGGPIPNCAYSKVRYVEYTNETFQTRVPPPGATQDFPWGWLGVLGPIIRAEVGDIVNILFVNATAGPLEGNYGMHPHGFRYAKDSEGAHYFGVNSGPIVGAPGAGAQVGAGQSFPYTWEADVDSGPGLGETSSKVWWYHSHIDEPFETNLGLLGPSIIYRKGFAKKNPQGKITGAIDVDKEFVTAFFIFDEAGGDENGLMHGINGYFFGNLKGLVMNKNQKVRWHLLGMGNEVDLHTPHWHGKTVRVGNLQVGRRTDVIELLPATMVTAEMDANNPGEWLFHCHVADHINAGMITTWCTNGPGFSCD